MAYARVVENVVVELVTPVPGFAISQCFHPDVVAQLQMVADTVQVGWVKQENGTFADPNAAPVVKPEPEPEPEPTPEPDPEPTPEPDPEPTPE